MSLTEDHYTEGVDAALEKWLDYCSRMTPADLVATRHGMDTASRLLFEMGDVEAAGGFLALADLIEQMRLACVAIQENEKNAE